MNNAEYLRERYYALKSRGKCVQCGKNDTYNGRVRCLVCLMDSREYYKGKQRSEEKRKIEAEKSKERRIKLLNAGICPVCGRRKLKEDRSRCSICLSRSNIKAKEYYHRKNDIARGYGGCYICGEVAFGDTRLCEQHYKNSLELLKKAREVRKCNLNTKQEMPKATTL